MKRGLLVFGVVMVCGTAWGLGGQEDEVLIGRRGDANNDGVLNQTDAVFITNHLFNGGPAPQCEAQADVDDDGLVAINDAVFITNYLFLGGPPPPPPSDCNGKDTTLPNPSCLYDPCT